MASKMPKKIGISISVDNDLLCRIDAFCKENYNAERSTVIAEAIDKFLKEKKDLKDKTNENN